MTDAAFREKALALAREWDFKAKAWRASTGEPGRLNVAAAFEQCAGQLRSALDDHEEGTPDA